MVALMFRTLVCRLKAVSPSEFWNLSPGEASLIIDEALPGEDAQFLQAGISAEQLERLEEKRAKLRAQGVKVL